MVCCRGTKSLALQVVCNCEHAEVLVQALSRTRISTKAMRRSMCNGNLDLPTGFHLMIAFNSAVSCSSVQGSERKSCSGSGFPVLSLEPGVFALDCTAASSCGVAECARFAFLRGGIVHWYKGRIDVDGERMTSNSRVLLSPGPCTISVRAGPNQSAQRVRDSCAISAMGSWILTS